MTLMGLIVTTYSQADKPTFNYQNLFFNFYIGLYNKNLQGGWLWLSMLLMISLTSLIGLIWDIPFRSRVIEPIKRSY